MNIKQYSIHLVANDALMKVMNSNLLNIEELCSAALEEHEKLYGFKLSISLNSFILETIGHAYAYQLLRRIRRVVDLKILRALSLKACLVDCGDKQHDKNRWFWDWVSLSKPFIFAFAKKKPIV